MILTYRILTTLFYPFLFFLIYLRVLMKKEDPLRYKEKIFSSHFNIIRKKDRELIWFHAASVGEFKSILPIIENLNQNKKVKLEFLITTTTLSSSNLAKEELKNFDNAQHRFFPFDVKFLIERFLNSWKPKKIILIDSEIWPNLILLSKVHKIPIALLNARLTSKTFKKWKKFPRTANKIFSSFDLCLTSNVETKNYLQIFNAKNIFFFGNIKLFNNIDENIIQNQNKDFLLKSKFWIAASIHPEEDIFCLKTHMKLKENLRNIITIIAPRHIERSSKIKKLCDDLNLNSQILDKGGKILHNKEVIIINSFGDLPNYFKYAKSVFIGKSIIKNLKNDSGQNPIEAAKLRCKIYHGPYVYNFREIYEILETNSISNKIYSFEELSKNLLIDLQSKEKKYNEKYNLINVLGHKTLTDTMKLINNFLFNDNK